MLVSPCSPLPCAVWGRVRCTPDKDSVPKTPTLGATVPSFGSCWLAGRSWQEFLLRWKGTEGVRVPGKGGLVMGRAV